MFDVIVFDVDNKDSSCGLSGPPAAFVETLILQKVCNLLTARGTVFLSLHLLDYVIFSMKLRTGSMCLVGWTH